jgi:hypothetical protein
MLQYILQPPGYMSEDKKSVNEMTLDEMTCCQADRMNIWPVFHLYMWLYEFTEAYCKTV